MTRIPPANLEATDSPATCARKIPYWSREQAEHVGAFRARKTGVPLHVYCCPFPEHYPTNGDHWHLTKMEQS